MKRGRKCISNDTLSYKSYEETEINVVPKTTNPATLSLLTLQMCSRQRIYRSDNKYRKVGWKVRNIEKAVIVFMFFVDAAHEGGGGR
jgi:hypothetical protein